MEFEFDPGKRARNVAKHYVDFPTVAACFDDPNKVVQADERFNYGEVRLNLLGMRGDRLFHVTYTMRGDVAWLISARKANDREQRRYAKAKR